MPPCSLLASTIMRISSSPTCSSASLGSMPMSRSIPLVDTVSSQTMGANSLEITVTSPEMPSATFSDCFMAMRLGTSSPNTSVK